MALINDSDLSQDAVFLDRVKMAIISTALAVQSEATNTANHAARSAYSLLVLNNPTGYAKLMAPGFTVDGAITSSSTDANLESRASAIFNAYCVQS